MDSGCLLAKCELCGCLVNASTLRARDYWRMDQAGALRMFTQVVCEDAAACYGRTTHPDHWLNVGAAIPVGREPDDGAPLARCHLCEIAAPLDELSISRHWDPDDRQWYESVACTDEAACEARQRHRPIPPELSQ